MAFSDPIIGGQNPLIRDEIQSENFVTNVSGWRIRKVGDAEFNDIIARGSLSVQGSGSSEIQLTVQAGQPFIEFTDSAGDQWTLQTVQNGGNAQFVIQMPFQVGPEITLTENFGIYMRPDDSALSGILLDPNDRYLKRGINTSTPENWTNLSLNSATATQPCQYKLFPDGMVRCRGEADHTLNPIPGGTVLFTLPAGYRPDQECRFPAVFNGATAHGKFTVRTNGNVEIGDAPNDKPCLESIVFSVDGAL